MTGHDTWREMTAAYVLGVLDAEDRAAFDAHLDDCPQCRDEVLAFVPLPALMARVGVEDLGGDAAGEPSADGVVDAVRSEVRGVERSRRRWRALAAVAAVVALVAGGAALTRVDGDEPADADGVALAIAPTSAVSGEIVADQRDWGTYVHMWLDDLPTGEALEVWVVDRAGAWQPAGTFAPRRDGTAYLGASTSLAVADIDRVVVTSTGRTEELLVAE